MATSLRSRAAVDTFPGNVNNVPAGWTLAALSTRTGRRPAVFALAHLTFPFINLNRHFLDSPSPCNRCWTSAVIVSDAVR